jgi:hypothetical protein
VGVGVVVRSLTEGRGLERARDLRV